MNESPRPLDPIDTLSCKMLPLLALSLSITVAGRVADNIWLTWAQVCEAFRREAQKINTTKDHLLYCFAHFDKDYRLASQVTDLFAVVLDFDHQTTEAFNNAIALAQRLSTRGMVHTTWSDDPHKPAKENCAPGETNYAVGDRCFRVIIPLDTPISIAQWADTWQTFAAAFQQHAGATPDGQCKNPNRRYYVPAARAVEVPGINQVLGGAAPTLICWGE